MKTNDNFYVKIVIFFFFVLFVVFFGYFLAQKYIVGLIQISKHVVSKVSFGSEFRLLNR